jgi:predicted Fe-Mo cluster-binding NifX family protein
MKICIPIEENLGLESVCYGHFGSAPMFGVVDTESQERKIEVIDNATAVHEHGMCNPVGQIAGRGIDGIIVCGMGSRAVQMMNENGIKVYYSEHPFAIKEIFENNDFKLREMVATDACSSHHDCGH